MKTAIIVDSTAGLPKELLNHPDIYQVDLNIHFNDGFSMTDTIDVKENSVFYQKLTASTVLPTTSQPLVGDYYTLVENLIKDGYDGILAIHLSSAISGTYNSAVMVLEEYQAQIQSFVVDSRSASIGMLNMVQEALQLKNKNYPLETIYAEVEQLVLHTEIRFMVQDLNNLSKGGRLSTAEALIGNMLKIKPVITFDAMGKLVVHDKIRTSKKVYQSFIEWIERNLQLNRDFDIQIAHANAFEDAEKLAELIRQTYGDQFTCQISILTPVLGTHTGQGLVGLGILPKATMK